MARQARRKPGEPRVGKGYLPAMAGDGRMRVRYTGHTRNQGWRDAYHHLLTMPLIAFFGVMGALYLGVNAAFALAYMTVGGIERMRPGSFDDAFFFSVDTMTTGYGELTPHGLGAHLLVTLEGFVGIFYLAIATGLLFARISRPTARVVFSDRALVTEHDGQRVLMVRAANQRRNRIVEAEVSVTLLHDVVTREGHEMRRFETLATTRARTPVFMLTWQIMHPIDELSALLGDTAESLAARNAQIIVVIRGLDETFAQTIHARAAYRPDQIVWGGRFANVILPDDDGGLLIDYAHFHDIA